MSFGSYGDTVKCDRCDYKSEYWSSWYYYHLVTGHQFPSPSQRIWCFDCNRLTKAELLPALVSVEQLEQQVEELKARGNDVAAVAERAAFLKTPLDPQQEFERELDCLLAKLNWRRTRQSPPRCLRCTGTNYFSPMCEGKPFAHPQCGGRLVFEYCGHAIPSRYQAVDGEGLPIEGGDGYPEPRTVTDLVL
jgi:hypothetical protein